MTEDQYKHINDRLRTIEKSVHFLEKREKSRRNFRFFKNIVIFLILLVGYYYLMPILESLGDSFLSIQETINKLPL